VLEDGTNTYLYGVSRIAQYDASGPQYFLGDALGSVRQLVDAVGNVTLAKSYQPYGEVLIAAGDGATNYGFTNEWTSQGLIYLRARWYSPLSGRFLSKDTWHGNYFKPMSFNQWLYVYANPAILKDPSGMSPNGEESGNEVARFIVQRMREDSNSEAIKNIYKLNTTHYYEDACNLYNQMSWWERMSVGGYQFLTDASYADYAARVDASAWFGCLVADAISRPVCGQWDYKADISRRWRNAQTVDFSILGIDEKVIFYYDIWANFHFGYLGLTGGFSEEALLTGAAIEHAASNHKIEIQDDPSDIAAHRIGFRMYKSNALSEATLLWWIYIEKSELNKAEIDEFGNIIRIYR
jgi:RHS repeat-associated protein